MGHEYKRPNFDKPLVNHTAAVSTVQSSNSFQFRYIKIEMQRWNVCGNTYCSAVRCWMCTRTIQMSSNSFQFCRIHHIAAVDREWRALRKNIEI